MPSTSATKCLLKAMEGSAGELRAHFNPTKFQVDKTIPWSKHPGKGTESPALEFTHGEPRNLSLELLFDTYETEGASVQTDIDILEQMTTPIESLGRPPKLLFQWGEFQFQGVIESMSVSYTMFRANGQSCRATVSVKMKQAERFKDKTTEDAGEDESEQQAVRRDGPAGHSSEHSMHENGTGNILGGS